MFEDKIEKDTVIINGTDTSNITVNLKDTIKNVVAVKHMRTYATINTDTQSYPNFQNVFFSVNDFDLKTAYINDKNVSCYGHLVFQGSNPSANFVTTKSSSTGIITDFYSDTDNYVLNPLLPQLNKLNIRFFKEDGSSIVMKEFTIEITVYSKHIKQTMF
jgi:hypothetical protein